MRLTYQGTIIELGERLLWTDEHAWNPVAMETQRGTQGDLQVFVRASQAGRPITLDGIESNAWFPRSEVLRLQAWAALPGAQFTLRLRGIDRTVMFDHSKPPAIEARAIWTSLFDAEFTPDLPHVFKLKFIEV